MSSIKNLKPFANTREVQKNTPVSQPIPGRESEMVATSGGFTFAVDDWTRLDRFLMIGAEESKYNVNAKKDLNAANIAVIRNLITKNTDSGKQVVERCVEISKAGRAKDNDYALFVLANAISLGNSEVKRHASNNLPLVARTGTHLMHFTNFANGLRGWGKNLKRSVQNWYNQKTPDQVAYQAIKYQSRDGWSQRDIFRLAHVHPGDDAVRNSTYKYIVKGKDSMTSDDKVPQIIIAFEQAKTADTKTLIKLIQDNRMSHEMIPNEKKGDTDVWNALLVGGMGTTAIVRNLNKMTAIGLLTPFSEATKLVVRKLTDVESLRKDRIHPMTLLIARKQYAAGHGDKGSLFWTPVATIVKALEDAFYLSFATIEPTGKNRMIGLDVSGSMSSACIGAPQLSCREVAAVMAMATLRSEPWCAIYGFDHEFRDLKITANDNLDTVMKKTYNGSFGSTNMSLPMELAERNKWKVDSFEIYTDNDINTGRNAPSQALKNYRSKMGMPHAKLVAVGCAINNFTIADPKDKGMLDVVGFDSQAPQFISQFVAGNM